MTLPQLVLASSSPYRKQLLERFGLPFDCASPDIDESSQPGEAATELVQRLARQKAEALRTRFPDHWIIGSDQVATLDDGTVLTKPHTHDRAVEQLRRCRDRSVRFLTGLALLDTRSGRAAVLCEPFDVQFRALSEQDIEHYLRVEQPYDCAGSFRMEGLGITLFSSLNGRDPNTLIGLPLIALCDLLEDWGLDLLAERYRISSRD
ncbi:Maf family protein [Marinobacter xestospongiae]|uniref:7-methyl-GTP pyrophosphatase n=1 Tax=Marinobacter xestospongiae TaxID=994319 RepID=A0ABU3VYF0_9GAMM|nr:nucleoside triphosphate pyrophosphatase [Marinobacter xestospongiae]MDV2078992.1 nucleoside triphosphate pyrophosphatase [Marinobacter xestospongiae]